jgi:hypothetical protein
MASASLPKFQISGSQRYSILFQKPFTGYRMPSPFRLYKTSALLYLLFYLPRKPTQPKGWLFSGILAPLEKPFQSTMCLLPRSPSRSTLGCLHMCLKNYELLRYLNFTCLAGPKGNVSLFMRGSSTLNSFGWCSAPKHGLLKFMASLVTVQNTDAFKHMVVGSSKKKFEVFRW